MKRYWLFAGKDYYPNGGIEDFKGDFDSVEDAKAAFDNAQAAEKIDNRKSDWAHIVDSTTAQIVVQFNGLNYMPEYQGWQKPESN